MPAWSVAGARAALTRGLDKLDHRGRRSTTEGDARPPRVTFARARSLPPPRETAVARRSTRRRSWRRCGPPSGHGLADRPRSETISGRPVWTGRDEEIRWVRLYVGVLGVLYPGGPMRHSKRLKFATAGLGISALMLGWALPGQTATQAADRGEGAAHGYQTSRVDPQHQRFAALQKAYAAMPLAFVENRRQTDPRVKYYAVGNHYAFFATRDELMLSLSKDKQGRELALALRFRTPQSGRDRHRHEPRARNGQLSRRQRTRPGRRPGSPATGRSSYRDLWPKIDMRLREQCRRPEVRVPRTPRRLAVRHPPGVRRRRRPRARRGRRRCRSRRPLGVLRDSAPVSYQDDRRRDACR